MILKHISSQEEARAKLKAGVDKLANTVKSTLGPGGKNVILDRMGVIHITKDGVTVANEIFLEDPVENIGAQIVKKSAQQTAMEAGDGTTTATVLAQAIFANGLDQVRAGHNPIDIKRGIDKAVKSAVEWLPKITVRQKTDDEVKKIASISSNNDPEITDLVSSAIKQVTAEGLILIEEAHSSKSDLRILEGLSFERGYMSDFFCTNREKMEVELDNPLIIMYQGTLARLGDVSGLLKKIGADASINQQPLFFIAEDFGRDFIETLARNVVDKRLRACCVQSPDFGEVRREIMRDIAAFTDATIIEKEAGLTLEEAPVTVIGSAKRVNVTAWRTTIIGADEEATKRRKEREGQIRSQMNHNNGHALTVLRDRLARLTGRVAMIMVGGVGEVEVQEKKDRVDDALHATKAAIAEGIVPGGGITFLRMKQSISLPAETMNEAERAGAMALLQALEVPTQTICENVNRADQLAKIKEKGDFYGLNARTLKIEDMMQAGVIDPTKVIRLALENAAATAGMLLTTDFVVTPIRQ